MSTLLGDFDEVVSPRECALAIGLPMSSDEFKEDLETPVSKDFACSQRRLYPKHSADTIWDVIVRPQIERLRAAAAFAKRMGVHVLDTRLTLTDLTELASAYKVVTIFAHWRPGTVFADQIVDVRRLATALSNPRGLLSARIYEQMRFNDQGTDGDFTKRFCEAANLVLSSQPPSSLALSERAWHHASELEYRLYANRFIFDSEFGDMVLLGNRVEFGDDMHSASAIREAIPMRFTGQIDLTVCNSLMLAEEIKAQRAFTCLADEKEVSLSLRAEIYKEIIAALTQAPFDYAEAARDIRLALLDALASRMQNPGSRRS